MKRILRLLFTFYTTLSLAQQPYYDDVNFTLNGTPLKDELSVKIINTHTNILSYSDRHNYLYDADEDLSNPANVILIYNGESRDEREYLSGSNSFMPQTFNTEHVYPQSLLTNDPPKGDLHHLRVCDIDINSARGNLSFASGSGSYGNVQGGWYPGDEWVGDVARMIMYMHLRYDEPFDDVGNLMLFLQWNAEDPVSPLEDQRNDVIFNAQGNRNPFIDNPYMATKIWGGPPAEDRWGTLGISRFYESNIKIFPLPAINHKLYIQSKIDLINKVSLYTVSGQPILSDIVVPRDNNMIVLDNLPSGFYVLKINSEKGVVSKKVIIN